MAMLGNMPATFEPVGSPAGQEGLVQAIGGTGEHADQNVQLQQALQQIQALLGQHQILLNRIQGMESSMASLRLENEQVREMSSDNSNSGSGSWLKVGNELAPPTFCGVNRSEYKDWSFKVAAYVVDNTYDFGANILT